MKAILLYMLFAVAGVACAAQLWNVNFDDTPQSNLVGPAGGGNTIWNNALVSPCDYSNIVDSIGVTTTVRFTCDLDGMDPWEVPGELTIFRSASRNFYSGVTKELVIMGLDTLNTYDIYVAGYYPNEDGSFGQYWTTNYSYNITNILNNGGGGGTTGEGINTHFVEGTNYVKFSGLIPNSSSSIVIYAVGLTNSWAGGEDYHRAMISGFQINTVTKYRDRPIRVDGRSILLSTGKLIHINESY